MNLNDYEKKLFLTYEAFAETVRFILRKAQLAAESLPQPQSIQCRAKGIESVRRCLAEVGKLDTQTLELDRHDLAGTRLIFYTNNDVDRFLASPLIRENFEVEEDSTRIHHPTPENKEARYRAVHCTVRLREDRVRLPEYARYAIPHYDDLPTAYNGLKGPLLKAVRAARATEPVSIETTCGNMDGFKADAVTRLVVEIVETLRYVDVNGTLQLLIDVYRDEPKPDIQSQIVNAVKHLSEYNIKAYEQVDPTLQMVLLDHLAGMSDAELDRIRPIALTV